MNVELLHSFEEIEREHVFIAYEQNSLFRLAVDLLELPDSTVYNLINVMRKSREVPELREAFENGLHLTKARRIVSVITPENQAEWIERARTLSKQNLERAVAAVNPRLIEVEAVRPSSADRNQIVFFTSNARVDDLRRAQDIVSSSLGRVANLEDTVAEMVDHFLRTKDPVVKAKRNVNRANASLATKVIARDGGRCQMITRPGHRCGARRFLQIHHKRSKFRGGIDHPDNLTTLCSNCHRAWHRRYGDVPLYDTRPDG